MVPLRIAAALALSLWGTTAAAQEAAERPGAPPSDSQAMEDRMPEDKLIMEVPDGSDLPPLSVVTYNLGLAHGSVALSQERIPAQIAAFQSLDADVLCLQEVWTDEDAAAITASLEGTYPYSTREITEDTSEESTPCGIFKTLRMSRCANKKCLDKGISIFECVDTGGACEGRYNALNDDCKRCLGANTAAPSSCAMGGAQDFIYSGRNGLLLLSKHPITDAAYLPFDAFLVTRGVLTAEVEGYRVMCTHMSADLGMLPYPEGAPVSSWQEEHAAQVERLGMEAEGLGCTLLAGDLNSGPTHGDLIGELEENWALIKGQGFVEPVPAPICTFCSDNPLAGVDKGRAIDHVMLKGCPESMTVEYERMFDQPISIEGQAEPTRLSDHYGLKATIRP